MARPPAQTPVYIRRTQLARERGYKSLSEQRKAQAMAKKSDVWNRATLPTPSFRSKASADLNRLYFEAFVLNPDDYSRRGPKARWFTEVAKIMTKDEWAARYPNGIREYSKAA